LSRFFALLLAVLLSGCGFHLQSAFTVPNGLERTYISTEDDRSSFYRELRRQLQANDMKLVDSQADATATLSIHIDDTGQRVLSVSARNVPTEYEVYYSVEYSVDSGEKTLLARNFITQTRDYTYDETLVLGMSHEETLLRDAIVDDLVRIVLKQLETL